MQLQQQSWNMEQAAMTTENLKNTVCLDSTYTRASSPPETKLIDLDDNGGCYAGG